MKNTTIALIAALAASIASAQTAAPAAPAATPAPAAMAAPAPAAKDMADAEIRKFDKDAKKITLKHGPIKNLDMPGMTMVFQVQDPLLLDKLSKMAVGDKIKFSVADQKGAYVVTAAEKAGTP